ncbi:hypothetical protein, conserved [Eimeria praecox]|uniref:Uncharacterized protein n=1 Tax=Eimeria praecox TaxID=51316 RepID=U6H3Z6_9EIME|nr:hypothetical protein, conserved [Eimeria praecox]
MQQCFWLFVTFLLVQQQNVYSSEAPEEVPENSVEQTPALKVSNINQMDSIGRLHAELAAQQEIADSQLALRLVSKKRFHAIALLILFLILIKAVAARKARERRKKEETGPKMSAEELLKKVELERAESEEALPEAGVSPGEESPTDMPSPKPRSKLTVEPSPEKPEEGQPAATGEPEEPPDRPITRARTTRREYTKRQKGPLETPATRQGKPSAETQGGGDPARQPAAAPPAQPTTQPATQPSVQPMMQPTHQPTVQPTIQPATQPITQPVVQPGAHPQSTFPQPPHPPAAGPAAPGAPGTEYPSPPSPAIGPSRGAPADDAVMIPEEDEELQELRARRSVISNLVDVATRLADELPDADAKTIASNLKVNVETAENAERQYDVAKSRGDPDISIIRNDTVSIMKASLEVARDALLNMATIAKIHGEKVQAYCSESLYFTHVDRLRKPLADSLETKSVSLCIATLSSLGMASITLQHENEDALRLLKSATFIDECEADDFIQVYGAVAALNFRRRALERLATLDNALKRELLEMHRSWLVGKLGMESVQMEMDANLVQTFHAVLSVSRPVSAGMSGSGITDAETHSVQDLFKQQYQEVAAMNSALSFEGITAAYERAKLYNQKLSYLLQLLKGKLNTIVEQQPLNKEEAAVTGSRMAQIGGLAVTNSEELYRIAQSLYAEVGGKPEEVGVGGGKGLFQKLATKVLASTSEQGEDAPSSDSGTAAYVKKYFSEAGRQIESAAKDLWVKAQEMLEAAKKTRKFKLDREGFGSTSLDKKTNLRIEAAKRSAEAAALQLEFRYLVKMAKEIETAESISSSVFIFPFPQESSAWIEVGRLKERMDGEKAMVKDARGRDVIPECLDTIHQTSMKMWSVLESVRLKQLNDAVHKARVDLHDAARE